MLRFFKILYKNKSTVRIVLVESLHQSISVIDLTQDQKLFVRTFINQPVPLLDVVCLKQSSNIESAGTKLMHQKSKPKESDVMLSNSNSLYLQYTEGSETCGALIGCLCCLIVIYNVPGFTLSFSCTQCTLGAKV